MLQSSGIAQELCSPEASMDNTDPQFDLSEVLWGTAALVGCIGMIVFEVVLFYVSTGKW
jgi:hypothetical protein